MSSATAACAIAKMARSRTWSRVSPGRRRRSTEDWFAAGVVERLAAAVLTSDLLLGLIRRWLQRLDDKGRH